MGFFSFLSMRIHEQLFSRGNNGYEKKRKYKLGLTNISETFFRGIKQSEILRLVNWKITIENRPKFRGIKAANKTKQTYKQNIWEIAVRKNLTI